MKDLGGAPEAFGIAGVGEPGNSIPYDGMSEENLAPPSTKGSENEISDEKGEGKGPSDDD